MAVLTLYTNNFPYGNSETFLESEINYLASSFKSVYILPFEKAAGQRILPENVVVLSPVKTEKWSKFSIYLNGLLYIRTLISNPELLSGLHQTSFLKSVKYLGYGIITKKNLQKRSIFNSDLHYSYWLTYSTFALALIKKEGKIRNLVSRIHGYDLYEERGEKGLTFIRPFTVRHLDKLYFISNHGLNYLRDKIPSYSEKFNLARLGSPDPFFTNPTQSNDGLVVLSCSVINNNKRIGLILGALALFKIKYPSVSVTWHHIGGGSNLREYINKIAGMFKESSIDCRFHGQLSNKEVFGFYRTTGVDVFLNVSESEGIPVSVMEAQSCAIPVAATNSGGMTEIVDHENGLILKHDLKHAELAEILHDIYINKSMWLKKRDLSRDFWAKNYSAEKNYSNFAQDLLLLAKS